MRFLLYSHDGVGLGHTSRNTAIARALVKQNPGSSVLLVTGADYLDGLGIPPEVEVLKLPGLRKGSNGEYSSRRLAIPDSETRALRSRILKSVVESFQPNVLLVDKHPFGVGGELRHALVVHQARRGWSVLGLRDILDDKETVLKEWAPYQLQSLVAHAFDRVLVYGQEEVLDPIREYNFPEEMRERTVFCGYVVNDREESSVDESGEGRTLEQRRSRPLALATAGGGEDGSLLLTLFLEASNGAPWDAVAVSGPLAAGPERDRLRALAERTGAQWRTCLRDFPSWLDRVDTLVCMGGYNTLAEAAARRTPIVCLPRRQPRREQVIRAEAFQGLGLLRMLDPAESDPKVMRQAITESVSASFNLDRSGPSRLRFDGAITAADELSSLGMTRRQARGNSQALASATWML